VSIFIFALLAGLLLHQLVSMIQPKGGVPGYKIGRRVMIRFSPGTYVIWKACALALAGLVFIVVVVLIVAQCVRPVEGYDYRFADVLTSPRMAAGVFGGLVGILLGNLLNRLLKNDDDYKFTSPDRLQLALIFALVILGIGGEDVLRSSAQRINKISVGTTTEISFADVAPKSSRVSAEQPEGAFRNTEGKSGESTGLAKLYDIGSMDKSNIDRDWNFIEVLARYQHEPLPKFIEAGRLAQNILSPLASCLMGISKLYGDDTFNERQLSRIADALRDLAQPGQTNYAEIRKQLEKATSEVTLYVGPRAAEFKLPTDERYSCQPIIVPSYDASLPGLNKELIDRFRDSRETLPYVTMAYASVEAALHHYEAATIAMDRWIRSDHENNIAQKWYVLRARLTQALFTDEWIRDRGAAASSSLRKYHIDNLRNIADGMAAFKVISELAKKNGGYQLTTGLLAASHSGDDGICDVPDLPAQVFNSNNKAPDSLKKQADATELIETIYNTYLSARKDYVDHALKHPTIKVRYASLIESEIKALMSLSLRCTGFGLEDQQTTRAEHIERYVRSQLNLMENTVNLKSSDKIEDQIRDSRQSLGLAFQLIDTQVINAKTDAPTGPIQHRIETAPVLETYETLLATQQQLQSFSERDVAN
jgi:hypothetical protein